MFHRVIDFLTGRDLHTAPRGDDDLELSVAALLVEAANMDTAFNATERATIERLLATRFDLDPAEAHELVVQAERRMRDASQLFPFTQAIAKQMDLAGRVQFVEMLWKVAYADGALDPHEDMLIRRVAGLIHVPDRDRGLARQRALEKLGRTG